MSIQELDEEFEDVNFDEIDAALKKLGLLGVVAQRDDNRFILAAPKQVDRKFTEPNVAQRIREVLRYNGPQTAQEIEDEAEDFDTKDILVALYELESYKEITQFSDKRWMLVWPKGKPDEIDQKTLQKGVSDAIDEVKQKHWAACMRTSNPTLASQIMDQLAAKPRMFSEVFHVISTKGHTVHEVMDMFNELEGLGQITSSQGLWSISDKSAEINAVRQNLHGLVDQLCNLLVKVGSIKL